MAEMPLARTKKDKAKQFLSKKKLNNLLQVIDAIKTGNINVVDDE